MESCNLLSRGILGRDFDEAEVYEPIGFASFERERKVEMRYPKLFNARGIQNSSQIKSGYRMQKRLYLQLKVDLLIQGLVRLHRKVERQ